MAGSKRAAEERRVERAWRRWLRDVAKTPGLSAIDGKVYRAHEVEGGRVLEEVRG